MDTFLQKGVVKARIGDFCYLKSFEGICVLYSPKEHRVEWAILNNHHAGNETRHLMTTEHREDLLDWLKGNATSIENVPIFDFEYPKHYTGKKMNK